MNKAFAIILVASMTGGCALMERNYGKIDVFAFPVYWRCSEGERKTGFLGPKGLLGVWSSTTNGVEYIVIPSLFTYYEPGKTFDSPLFSWSEEGTFKVLMTGRGVHNSFTNICITPFMGVKANGSSPSGIAGGMWNTTAGLRCWTVTGCRTPVTDGGIQSAKRSCFCCLGRRVPLPIAEILAKVSTAYTA